MAKDRTTGNWLLGLGYLMVAFVILLNYIGQKGEAKGPTKATSIQREQAETNVLQSQLVEQKRINREMSEMITNMQSAIKSGGHYTPSTVSGSGSSAIGDQNFEDVLANGLPLITASSASDPAPQAAPAHPTAKNPFLPFYDPATQAKKDEDPAGSVEPTSSLRPDPLIPLLLHNTWTPSRLSDSLQLRRQVNTLR
jgi:hypothetical protein